MLSTILHLLNCNTIKDVEASRKEEYERVGVIVVQMCVSVRDGGNGLLYGSGGLWKDACRCLQAMDSSTPPL